MRVLQIGKFYPISGGVEKVMYDITMGLSQKQVYCDMLCASAEKQDQGNLLLNDYARVLCVPTWKKVAATMLSPAMIFRLRNIIHTGIVHDRSRVAILFHVLFIS